MQLDNLIKYQIQDFRTYKGLGDIQNIKNKILNKVFELYSDTDNQFSIELRFQAPSIVTEVNMRLLNTNRFQLQFIDSKNKPIQEFNKTNTNKDDQIVLMLDLNEPVRYVKLKILKSPLIEKRLGIRYIIFKGINDQVDKKSHNKKFSLKDNLKIQNFLEKRINTKKDIRSLESKQMFKNREKQKGIKEEVQKLIDFTNFQNEFNLNEEKKERDRISLEKVENKLKKKTKLNQQQNLLTLSKKSYERHLQQKNKQKEKEETELAIALSRSVQKQQQNFIDQEIDSRTMKIEEEEPLPAGLENYYQQQLNNIQMQQEFERTYQTIEFNEDYLAFFSNMSPEWLEAQRKAEIEHNVREDERISNFIRIKWLYDTEIYIQGFEEWRMDQIQHQAKLLGCKLISELKNDCIAIVPKQICQKLKKKHKQWKQVKYLTPNYLQDCINKQQKLSFRGYYLN